LNVCVALGHTYHSGVVYRGHGGLGLRTSPLFENIGLVIDPNLHRNSEGEVEVERNFVGDLTTQRNIIRKKLR